MLSPEIRVFRSLEDLSHAAATEFRSFGGPALSGICSAALSGGSTPRRFYDLLGGPSFSESITWPRVHLFQVDERCVSPDDTRSNYRMIREVLLDRVPSLHFHRMAAEQTDRDAASQSYEAEIRAVLGTQPGAWPCFDIIYLGMGDDGHTASLFPGTAALSERKLAVCPNYVERLQMFRLTLTLPVLNAAARVVFIVSGAEKAEMLRQVLSPAAGEQPKFPAQLVQPTHGTVAWYLDEAAARLL